MATRRDQRLCVAGALLLGIGTIVFSSCAEDLLVRWSVWLAHADYSRASFVVDRVSRESATSRGGGWRWVALGTVNGETEVLYLNQDSPHRSRLEERYEHDYPRGRELEVLYRPDKERRPLFGPSLRVVSKELVPSLRMRLMTLMLTMTAIAPILVGVALIYVSWRMRGRRGSLVLTAHLGGPR